jgi:hypothetical protein
MSKLIEPKEVEIKIDAFDAEGNQLTKPYIVSKFPTVAGRAIMAQYVTSAIPKVGDYKTNEETMFKLMNYVAITQPSGAQQRLSTQALIDNSVDSWETCLRIEWAMLEHNFSFFRNGKALEFLMGFFPHLKPWILKMSTRLSEPSSEPVKPPTPN